MFAPETMEQGFVTYLDEDPKLAALMNKEGGLQESRKIMLNLFDQLKFLG